jgi:hypothetical protein
LTESSAKQTYRLQHDVARCHADSDVVVQPERSVRVDKELLHLDGAECKVADGQDPHTLFGRNILIVIAVVVLFFVRLLANQALQQHNL